LQLNCRISHRNELLPLQGATDSRLEEKDSLLPAQGLRQPLHPHPLQEAACNRLAQAHLRQFPGHRPSELTEAPLPLNLFSSTAQSHVLDSLFPTCLEASEPALDIHRGSLALQKLVPVRSHSGPGLDEGGAGHYCSVVATLGGHAPPGLHTDGSALQTEEPLALSPPLQPDSGEILQGAHGRHRPPERPSSQVHADQCLATDDPPAFQLELNAASVAAPGRLKRASGGLLRQVGRPLYPGRLACSPSALKRNSYGFQGEEGFPVDMGAPGCLEARDGYKSTAFFLQSQQLLPRQEHPANDEMSVPTSQM